MDRSTVSEVALAPYVLDDRARALLEACALPTSDLDEAAQLQLFALTRGSQLLGLVGLELHGKAALLRSLAVAPEVRGRGHARVLVQAAEHAATAAGVASVYLLTTTAAPFFAGLAYVETARADAPPSIAATRQFAGLCPASSNFMSKRLAS